MVLCADDCRKMDEREEGTIVRRRRHRVVSIARRPITLLTYG